MKFTRLRLSGFKSFVEPTELLIEPGLTGVVGPNGCGKSNLLEALRWVMGESSTRNVRAAEMDDVIFTGTDSRPARNMAEVTVSLDNGDHSAPPEFNGADVIEVSRRIEREAGSAYRINGNDVRARDVQLLFADAATGARSPALVRQGQIGEIINAKPQSRRRILEEAAGITGLHARRHEAELKLRAAEANLARLDDVVAQLGTQLQGLQRQARQAVRYKHISATIRRLEAAQLYFAWQDADRAATHDQQQLGEATRDIAARTLAASQASRARDVAAEALPPLREEAAAGAAAVQRLASERAQLDREEAEARRRAGELEARLQQTTADLNHEREILQDAEAALVGLEAERTELMAADAGEAEARAAAAAALKLASDELAQAQEAADVAHARLSELIAQRNTLLRQIDEHGERIARLTGELTRLDERQRQLAEEIDTEGERAKLAEALEAAVAKGRLAEGAVAEAEAACRLARSEEAERRQEFDAARQEADKLAAEVRTLAKLLKIATSDLWPPIVDAVKVAAGCELALAAAIGDDIEAPADEAAPVHWRTLPPVGSLPLPPGAEPLSRFVDAPPAFARRLAHIGIVPRAQGAALQSMLAPGQRLVSRDGDLWRWDGFTAAAEAPTAAAKRLAERNRLEALEPAAAAARQQSEKARRDFEAARAAADEAGRREREAREAWRSAVAATERAREACSLCERRTADRDRQFGILAEAVRRVSQQLAEADTSRGAAAEALAGLDQPETLLRQADSLRQVVEARRTAYSEARARHDGFEVQARARRQRIDAIATDRAGWRERAGRASAHTQVLEMRAAEAQGQLAELAGLPAKFGEQRRKLLTLSSEAEGRRQAAADAVQEAENRVKAAEAEWRSAETALTEARENHARVEARAEAAGERRHAAERRINDILRCRPEEVIAVHQLGASKLPEPDGIEARLASLRDQRERLGAVNLRAEQEAEEVAAELDRLTGERDDVVQAVHKLRQAIASLNREGRERLLQAFGTVNDHFASLFKTLFNGGRAELQLVESDDPLEAGLELVAYPPGKRPQVLSLLSGGEQALTALALIFAVFLTNPSPICVLDEVDAPLDDSNVERFCNLLDAMLERTDTRFLIITHNPITMARMHRLYGVTMMERGVSQLVSVDLERAERLAAAE